MTAPDLRRERVLVAAAFGALLIASAFLIFRLSSERQDILDDFQRGSWLAVQAQAEHLRLSDRLSLYEIEPSDANRDALMQRFRAFWSSLPILAAGLDSEKLRSIQGVPALTTDLAGRLTSTEAALDALVPGDSASFAAARQALEQYRAPLQSLVLTALRNQGVADSRSRIERQYNWILAALLAVLVSGTVLMLLQRQQARNACASYELARRAEAEASETKLQLMDAIESISEGFILLDDTGHVVMANNRYREIYPAIADLVEPGVAFEDLIWAGAVLDQYDSEQTVEQIVRERLERLANPSGPFEQALRNGRSLLVSERRTRRGSLVSVRTDITEIKRTQIELQNRLAAMEASIDGIAIIDMSDRLIGVNKAFAAIFGYPSADSLVGRPWSALFDDDENVLYELK